MASSGSAKLCLGCGGLAKSRDRRTLEAGGQVTLLWEKAMDKVLEIEQQEFDCSSLIHNGDGFMCRKCFYAFEKFIEKFEVSV